MVFGFIDFPVLDIQYKDRDFGLGVFQERG
jgi:hypothetical protein